MGTLSIGTIEQSCSSSFAFRLSTEAQRSRKSDESRVSRIAQRLRSDLSRSLLARSVCNGEKFSWPEFLTPKKKRSSNEKAFKRSSDFFSRVVSHPSQPNGLRVQKFEFHSKVIAKITFLFDRTVYASVPAHHLMAETCREYSWKVSQAREVSQFKDLRADGQIKLCQLPNEGDLAR